MMAISQRFLIFSATFSPFYGLILITAFALIHVAACVSLASFPARISLPSMNSVIDFVISLFQDVIYPFFFHKCQ